MKRFFFLKKEWNGMVWGFLGIMGMEKRGGDKYMGGGGDKMNGEKRVG